MNTIYARNDENQSQLWWFLTTVILHKFDVIEAFRIIVRYDLQYHGYHTYGVKRALLFY